MPMPWFRFYHEWASDPKVQSLPFEQQGFLVMIFCWHAAGTLQTLTDEVIADTFRLSMEELAQIKAKFESRGFVGDGWTPKNWEKRQRASDSSAARVKAFKERKKAGNGQVTVTSPLANGYPTVTETLPLLISSSSLTTNACIKEEEKDTREVTVTSPLANGYPAVPDTTQPAYPDPATTMHHVDTGPCTIEDATARDIWGRIWAAWKDESLCIGWYRWQQQYSSEVWVAAFSQTKEQYPNQKVNIGLVAKLAAGIAANGRKAAKPFAAEPAANGRPKTKRQEYQEAAAAKLAKLKAEIGDDEEDDQP